MARVHHYLQSDQTKQHPTQKCAMQIMRGFNRGTWTSRGSIMCKEPKNTVAWCSNDLIPCSHCANNQVSSVCLQDYLLSRDVSKHLEDALQWSGHVCLNIEWALVSTWYTRLMLNNITISKVIHRARNMYCAL